MQYITQFYYLIGNVNSMWVQGLVSHALELLISNNSFSLFFNSNSKFIASI